MNGKCFSLIDINSVEFFCQAEILYRSKGLVLYIFYVYFFVQWNRRFFSCNVKEFEVHAVLCSRKLCWSQKIKFDFSPIFYKHKCARPQFCKTMSLNSVIKTDNENVNVILWVHTVVQSINRMISMELPTKIKVIFKFVHVF